MDELYSNTNSVNYMDDGNKSVNEDMSEDCQVKISNKELRQEFNSPEFDRVSSSCKSSKCGLEEYCYSSNDFECSDSSTQVDHDAYQTDSLEQFASLEQGFQYEEENEIGKDSENCQGFATKESPASGHDLTERDYLENYNEFEADEPPPNNESDSVENYLELNLEDTSEGNQKLGIEGRQKKYHEPAFGSSQQMCPDVPVHDYFHQELVHEEGIRNPESKTECKYMDSYQDLKETESSKYHNKAETNEYQEHWLETAPNSETENYKDPPPDDYYQQECETGENCPNYEPLLEGNLENYQKHPIEESSTEDNDFKRGECQDIHRSSAFEIDKKRKEGRSAEDCLQDHQQYETNNQENRRKSTFTNDSHAKFSTKQSSTSCFESEEPSTNENHQGFKKPPAFEAFSQEKNCFETEASKTANIDGVSSDAAELATDTAEALHDETSNKIKQGDDKESYSNEDSDYQNGTDNQLENKSTQNVVTGQYTADSMLEETQNYIGEETENCRDTSRHRSSIVNGSHALAAFTEAQQNTEQNLLIEIDAKHDSGNNNTAGEGTLLDQSIQRNNFNFQAVSALPWQRSAEKTRRVSGESLMKLITDGGRAPDHTSSDKKLSILNMKILESQPMTSSQLSQERVMSGNSFPQNSKCDSTSTSLPKLFRKPTSEYMEKLESDVRVAKKARSEEVKTIQDQLRRRSSIRHQSSFDVVRSLTTALFDQGCSQVHGKGIELEEPQNKRSKVEPLEKLPLDDKKDAKSRSPKSSPDKPTMHDHISSSPTFEEDTFVSVKSRKAMFSCNNTEATEKRPVPPQKLTPLATEESATKGSGVSREREKGIAYKWEYKQQKDKDTSLSDTPIKRPATPSLIPRRVVDRPASPMLPTLKIADAKPLAERVKGSSLPIASGGMRFRRPGSASKDGIKTPVQRSSRPSTPVTDFRTARAQILKCPLGPVKIPSKHGPQKQNRQSQVIKVTANQIESKLLAMKKGPNISPEFKCRGTKEFVEELNDEVELLPSVFERFKKPRRQRARGPSRQLLRNACSTNEVY